MISGVLIPLEGALRRLTGALKYGTVEDSGQPRRGAYTARRSRRPHGRRSGESNGHVEDACDPSAPRRSDGSEVGGESTALQVAVVGVLFGCGGGQPTNAPPGLAGRCRVDQSLLSGPTG